MKRLLMIMSAILVFALLLTACGQAPQQLTHENSKISVVCTVFSVYDWVTEIIGENNSGFSVIFLGENGDPHSFQPTLQDMAKISLCDLLVYVGGESDKWVEQTVKDEGINALRLFDVNKGELISTEHGHHNHEYETDYDEHIWLSLSMAERTVNAICDAICRLDAENSEEYRANTESYCQRLRALDKEYARIAEQSEDKTIIFADRFPFRYLTEDYGIECIAAFPNCSADADASFETIARLAEAVDEYEKETLLVLENSDRMVAETVIKSTSKKSAKIQVMNSCQAVTKRLDYLEIMTENLSALEKALK